MQVVEKSPVDFPAVSVCNLNPFDRSKSQSYIDKVLANNNISYVDDINKIDMNPSIVTNLIRASIAADKNLTDNQRRQLGFDIDYMLLTCYFNDIPCNSSDFVWRYDFDYTNCFTFNSGFDSNGNRVPIKQMNEAGSDRSLRIELFLGDEFSQGKYLYNSGAHVVVHNQSITPLIETEGRDISTVCLILTIYTV
jgi:hypothetical protein